MGCTHEMKQGAVTTVVNAGGLLGGCMFCRADQAEGDRDTYRAALAVVYNQAQLLLGSDKITDAGVVQGLKRIIAESEIAFPSAPLASDTGAGKPQSGGG